MPNITRPSPDLFGLIDATSNSGSGWPGSCGCACATPRFDSGSATENNSPRQSNDFVCMFVMSGSLVFRRMFSAIDDQHVDRSAARIQFESELLLKRREDRRSVGIDR